MKILCILFSIFFLKISAQSEIKGFVVSGEGQPVFRANIILSKEHEQIETFAFSQKDGSFLLSTSKTGSFDLEIRYSNFYVKKMALTINNTNKKIDFGKVEISAIPEKEIKEVVVSGSPPIKLKKDTVEFKARNFSNGTEQNVEELLKKLPGITVQSDGRIRFGNKEVDRVMVENDDLFERGYQTLTQNMPSKPLDKVQVLNNYSKNKLLKGIEKNESIAINLILKEDAKGKWFGNILLASTSYKEDMRQGKLNVMNFRKRQKIYLLANANNLGLNEMKGVEYLIHPSADTDVENVGADINTLSIVNLHQRNFQFDDKRTNFNNDKLASLNYIYNFKTDWKLKFVTIFNETENRNYINSYYKFNYDGVNFANTEDKTWKQNNRNIVGKLELTKDFKNNSSVQIYNKISSLNEDNNNIFIFNQQLNNQNGNNRLFANENKLTYTKKIDSGRAVVAVARYIFQGRPYSFIDENDVFRYITGNADVKKVNQVINSRMNFGGVKISYLKKYAEDHTLEIQLGDEFRKDFLNSDIFLYNANDQSVDFDKSDFVNHTDYTRNNIFAQGKYQKKSDKWSYGITVLNQVISSNLNTEKQTGFYIAPSANIGYQNKKTGNFTLSAGRKFSTTSINDVYTRYIYQGSRDFKRSDAGFAILPDYNVGFSYNLGNILSEYLNFNINYFRNGNYLSSNRIVNPNYVFNQTILVKDNNTLFSNLELRKYIKLLKSRISFLGSYMLSDSENSINNRPLIRTRFANLKTGFEMKSGWTGFMNYELGYEWSFNNISSEVNSNSYQDQKGFVNLYFTFAPQFRIESYLEYYKFGNTSQKTTRFWDVKINYTIKNNLSLFIQGNNLLDSNSIQKYSVNNISESLYTQRLMPAHVVLGVNKNF